ncbi:hypothetical protein AB0H73_38575 [Streptomyces olivoreticuli]
MPYTPDTATVHRLAAGVIRSAVTAIGDEFSQIGEMIQEDGADLSADDFHTLNEAVAKAVQKATVDITWPDATP